MNMLEEQEYSKHFDFSLWKKMFRFALPYKKNLTTLGFMMIAIAGIDAIFPFFSKIAVDTFVVDKNFTRFPLYCIAMGTIITLQALNVWVMIRMAGKVEVGVPYDIRKCAYQKLQELPLTYYDRTPVGWIMARMTSDVKKLGQTLSWNLVDMVWALAMMAIMLCFMFFIHWKLALIVLGVVPFLITISILFQRKILRNTRKVRKLNSHITSAFNEGIMGAKTIKTLVREKESLQDFSKVTGEFRDHAVHAATLSSIYTPIVILLGSIGTALVLWRGGNGVMAGDISYGTLVAFISYTVQFFDPVKQFARVFNELQYAQASAERVLALIETDPDIKDSEEVLNLYGQSLETRKENWPKLKGDISFRNVTFSYKDGENVLKSFNLDIKAGETVALVGETGSGKTTIVNLACRFYEPTEGEIQVDGVDYRKRPLLWLHSNLGYVLQEPHLFSGTIRENIAYGKFNATDEEITHAARLVNAHGFITKLEKGYDTEVGERGSRLSTGQKQLISLARAILANPKIFVLDEATSSVDTETEHLIQEAIQNVLKGRTSFIIAHRLSTIRAADKILVIEKGKVIEQGTHKQLLQHKGYYYRLYTNQFMEEQGEKLLSGNLAG